MKNKLKLLKKQSFLVRCDISLNYLVPYYITFVKAIKLVCCIPTY